MAAVEGLKHVARSVNPAFRRPLGSPPSGYDGSHSHSPRSALEKRVMDSTLAIIGIPGLDHILGGCLPANRLQAKDELRAGIAGLIA